MTKIGVIKQLNGQYPFIYAIADTFNQAETIAVNAWKNGVTKDCYYFVRTIPDNALIGDCL